MQNYSLYTYKCGSLKVEEYSTKTFGCSLNSNAETICSNSIWIFYCKFPCMYSISKWKKNIFLDIYFFSIFGPLCLLSLTHIFHLRGIMIQDRLCFYLPKKAYAIPFYFCYVIRNILAEEKNDNVKFLDTMYLNDMSSI